MTHQFAAPQIGSTADLHTLDRRAEVLETLELRWFAPGRIPNPAVSWFEASAPHVEVEERIDSYLMIGRPDIGVKRRDSGPLEVKVRRCTGRRMSVGDVLVGHVEEWHKQTRDRSPAAGERWLDVHKTVITYPFRLAGAGGLVAGCDIELAAVRAEEVEAWTLAFEASGPRSDRMSVLRSAMEQFLADLPAGIAAALDLEAGYPAWLMQVAGL